jgi:hypothetical protein
VRTNSRPDRLAFADVQQNIVDPIEQINAGTIGIRKNIIFMEAGFHISVLALPISISPHMISINRVIENDNYGIVLKATSLYFIREDISDSESILHRRQ